MLFAADDTPVSPPGIDKISMILTSHFINILLKCIPSFFIVLIAITNTVTVLTWSCCVLGEGFLCEDLIVSLRYPFYMLGCFDTEWKTLTWLRYTVWIPLYPLGVLAEGELVVIHYHRWLLVMFLTHTHLRTNPFIHFFFWVEVFYYTELYARVLCTVV